MVVTTIRLLPVVTFVCLQFSFVLPKSTTSSKPLVLVVSFDGFRHSYLSSSRTPILTNLTATGSSVPYLIPSFPSKTFPNHQSIATGLYTESHGIVDNTFYDTLYKATLDGKKGDPGFWNYDSNLLPLWIRNEQQGGISGCMMWPGSDHGYGINNNLFPTYYHRGYNSGLSWDTRVNTVVSWMTDRTKPANLVYMYYHQPDGAGHSYGPRSENTLNEVRETDRRVGVLIEKLKTAGIYDRVNLVILSDHGMEEVSSSTRIDLSFVNRNIVEDVNGDSPVIQVVPKSGKGTELYNALESGCRTRNCTVFKKSGALCGEPYYYCKGRRIHNYVTLADPGWTFSNSLSKSRNKRGVSVYGSHGYINTAESMRVFLIAKGPAFKTGYVTDKPAKNVDVVPLLSKLIGLSNVPSNGTLSRVEKMLK